MGRDPRSNAAIFRRTEVQKCAYSNNTYPYIPAIPACSPADRFHSHAPSPQRNYSVTRDANFADHSLKTPSTGFAQPHYDTRYQPCYPYAAAGQPRGDTTEQNRAGQTLVSNQDQRKRHAYEPVRSVPVHKAEASSRSPIKPAVMMAFVPEQPVQRAMVFKSSLFQRNDPPLASPQPYQRMPLSELNISFTISLDRYTPTTHSPPPEYVPRVDKPTRIPAPAPLRRPSLHTMPPLVSPPPRYEHASQQSSTRVVPAYPQEKENEAFTKAPPRSRHLTRNAVPLTRPVKA